MKKNFYNDFVISWILFISTFGVAAYFSRIGLDAHHDGIMFKPALDVASGLMLFRDTFSQYNSVTTLLQAGSLLLFGKYVLTIKLFTAAWYGLISVLLYGIYKRFLPRIYVSALIILWIAMAPYYIWTFLPWSSVYACGFLLLSAYCYILFIEKKFWGLLTLCGISAGLTFWTKQSVGIPLLGMMLLLFVYEGIMKKEKIRILVQNLIYFLLGLFVISFGFLYWLYRNNALSDWYIQTFTLAYRFGREWGNAYDIRTIIWNNLFPISYYPSFIYSPVVWIVFPVCTLIIGLWNFIQTIRKRHGKTQTMLMSLVFISIASWMQYYPLIDYRHTYWAATPMLGLVGYLVYRVVSAVLSRWNTHFVRYSSLFSILIIGLVLFPDLKMRYIAAIQKINQPYITVKEPKVLAHLKLLPDDAKYYEFIGRTIQTYLDTHPDRNVVNLGNDALFLTFDKRVKNIHPLYVNWKWLIGDLYENYDSVYETYIGTKKPLVITNTVNVPKGYCSIRNPYRIAPSEVSEVRYANGFLYQSCVLKK